jgi:hypothetical protein
LQDFILHITSICRWPQSNTPAILMINSGKGISIKSSGSIGIHTAAAGIARFRSPKGKNFIF